MKNQNNFILYFGIIGPTVFFLLMYLILPQFYPDFNFNNQFVSELGAVNSPVKFFANYFGFLMLGVCLILFAIGVYKISSNKIDRIFSISIFLSGVLIGLISFLPCEIKCQNITLIGRMHNLFSDLQIPIIAMVILLFIYSQKLILKKYSFIKPLFIIWLLSFTVWALSVLNLLSFDAVGLFQRITLATSYFFFVCIAFILINENKKPAKLQV